MMIYIKLYIKMRKMDSPLLFKTWNVGCSHSDIDMEISDQSRLAIVCPWPPLLSYQFTCDTRRRNDRMFANLFLHWNNTGTPKR